MRGGRAARVTVYDIAREAHTSPSTVSRVLNGSTLIAEPTRASVLAAARRLGYDARRIRRPASRSILNIVVFLPRAAEPYAHAFYDVTALFAGIERGFGEVRAHTVAALAGTASPFEGKKLGDVDGCIFAFSEPSPDVRVLLDEREIPVVLINRTDPDLACVANDAGHGMGLLAAHIAGRRPDAHPLFVTVESALAVSAARFHALTAGPLALAATDRVELPTIATITSSQIDRLRRRGYDTFVCVNDLVAVAVTERLRRVGARLPEDAAVTGYDGAPVRGLVECPITSVDLAVERQGELAATMLVEAVLERRPAHGCNLVRGDLIVGESV